MLIQVEGRVYPFAKLVDSPYFSESELRGGAVTVSFSKYLPWQAMHFFQRSTHSSKMHLFQTQHRIQFRSQSHAISGLFQSWKVISEARNFDVINGLPHVLEKWVKRCKKCIAYQGRYFEKETVTAPPQVPTRRNKVCPLTLQTALVIRNSSSLTFCSCLIYTVTHPCFRPSLSCVLTTGFIFRFSIPSVQLKTSCFNIFQFTWHSISVTVLKS
jgi:hypothetical protein